MKIFMGMHTTGSLMGDYAAGFRSLGHEVFCVTQSDSGIVRSDVDINIPQFLAAKFGGNDKKNQKNREDLKQRLLQMAWQKALEADLCFFIWNSFLPDASDLRTLRNLGKKIVVRFCGSEVRDPEVERQMAALHGSPYTDYGLRRTDLPFKLRYLRTCEKYADLLICGSTMSLRPVSGKAAMLFQPESNVCNMEQRKIPILLHAPSNTLTKGTNIWLQIFDALRSSGLQFGVKLLQGISHSEMPEEYARADIFCNSLFFGGRASWEAMAAGCVVVSGDLIEKSKSYAHLVCEANLQGVGLPVDKEESASFWWNRACDKIYSTRQEVGVNSDTAAEELAKLILDWPRRQQLAREGVEYVTEKLSPRVACQEILEYLTNPEALEQRASLVWTPFFSREYSTKNNTPEEIALFNHYTDMVRPCKWYRDYVEPTEREGLRF